MKKDIVKVVMAIGCIVLALVTATYLDDLKDIAKQENKKEQQTQSYREYENNFSSDEFDLPVLLIDTNGKTMSREEDILGQLQVYDNKNGKNSLENEPDLTSKININIRGNSSSKYPKKQFGIELINGKGDEKSERLLGLPKESDWVLNGPFLDKSLMRNYIALNISGQIMEYAPKVKFCEVIVVDDGKEVLDEDNYRGVYILVEKIKRDEERVDITKSQDNTNETSFILAKDRQKPDDILVKSYGKEISQYHYGLNVIYPKKDLTQEKYDYITKSISEFERILYSDKFNHPTEGYSKYIEVDTFVDYYIINEFFKNTDAGMLSTYVYKDYEEKMKAGPVWDFNESLGNTLNKDGEVYDYTEFTMIHKPWFDRLMQDVNFADKVVQRYKELRKTYLSDEYIHEFIDETVELLGDAPKHNFERWPIYLSNQAKVFEDSGELTDKYSANLDIYIKYLEEHKHLLKNTDGMATSYEEEIALMKEYIVNRGKWMDSNIDSLKKWAK